MFIIKKSSIAGEIKAGVGGVMLWYGIRPDVPANFEIYTPSENKFIKGGEAVDTSSAGSATHEHADDYNPRVGSVAHHTHTPYGFVGDTGGQTLIVASGGSAEAVTPANHTHTTGGLTVSPAGSHDHSRYHANFESSLPDHVRLYWIKRTDYNRDAANDVPIGGIVAFSGAIANKPTGFALCDGGTYNGYATPDLRDRFVYGAEYDEQSYAVGGQSSHTHTIPATSYNGDHSHFVSGAVTNSTTGLAGHNIPEGDDWASGDNHTHTVSGSLSIGTHRHLIDDSGPANQDPPYMLLYFIMRTV